jgi:protein xylosyltransferase
MYIPQVFQAVAQVNNIHVGRNIVSESELRSPNIKKRDNLPDKNTNQEKGKNIPSPLQFMKQLKNRVLQEVKSTNSSENLSKLTPTPNKKKTAPSLPSTKSLSSTLVPYPLPNDLQSCSLVGKKDAVSAVSRAKTQECKDLIKNITCLQQGGRLYDLDIMNLCPIGRDPGRGFQKISYDQGEGPNARVVFLMSIHGRAHRQVKRLFKAIYHTDHYFFIHVDSVSFSDYYYYCVTRSVCIT